jgi:hypothetical protein
MQSDRDSFIHVLYAIILVQFVAIAVLLGGFSNEYLANLYFRAWVDNSYPWLGSLLQGQAVALLVGMALGATVLLIQRFRAETKLRDEAGQMMGGLPVQTVDQDYLEHSVSRENRLTGEGPRDVLAELEKIDS